VKDQLTIYTTSKRKNGGKWDFFFKKKKTQLTIYVSQVLHSHRATSSEIVASLSEQISGCNVDLFSSSSSVFLEKAGFFGVVRAAVSFFSIEETASIDGLSLAFSWTHKRAICMHLINLHDKSVSSRVESINSMPLHSFHSSYA